MKSAFKATLTAIPLCFAMSISGIGHSNASTTHSTTHSTTSTHSTHRHATVWVYFNNAESDGGPVEIAKAGVYNVHHCHPANAKQGNRHPGECVASVHGMRNLVFVSTTDFH